MALHRHRTLFALCLLFALFKFHIYICVRSCFCTSHCIVQCIQALLSMLLVSVSFVTNIEQSCWCRRSAILHPFHALLFQTQQRMNQNIIYERLLFE